jgi:hypothetical protein
VLGTNEGIGVIMLGRNEGFEVGALGLKDGAGVNAKVGPAVGAREVLGFPVGVHTAMNPALAIEVSDTNSRNSSPELAIICGTEATELPDRSASRGASELGPSYTTR